MIRLLRPTDLELARSLDALRDSPFNYVEIGCTSSAPPSGYAVDRNRERLGSGSECFDQARRAIRSWAMLNLGWVEVFPRDAPIAVGNMIAVIGRVLGVHGVFACRIIMVEDDPDGPTPRFHLSYGTLPGHLLAGEEQFRVWWDRQDDSVWFEVLAYSRPSCLLARLAYPALRAIQKRFGPLSLQAIKQSIDPIRGTSQ